MMYVSKVSRTIAIGLLGAALVGVPAGIVGRVLMRLIAVALGDRPGYSLSGTIGILVAYVVLATPGGLALAAVQRRGRARWAALAFAAAGIVSLNGMMLLGQALDNGFSSWDQRAHQALFVAAYLLYGALLAGEVVALAWVTTSLGHRPGRSRWSPSATSAPPSRAGRRQAPPSGPACERSS